MSRRSRLLSRFVAVVGAVLPFATESQTYNGISSATASVRCMRCAFADPVLSGAVFTTSSLRTVLSPVVCTVASRSLTGVPAVSAAPQPFRCVPSSPLFNPALVRLTR